MNAEDSSSDEVLLLECNLDDMTGEELGHALGTILSAGALDAWFAPIYMKKNRPATLLSVLVRPEQGYAMRRLLLEETSTLGVRWRRFAREIAQRRVEVAQTPWGEVRCKLKILDGHVVSAKPEYEDCSRFAQQNGLSFTRVLDVCRQECTRFVTGGDSRP